MKTSIRIRGLDSSMEINIFIMKYNFFSFFIFSIFFESLHSKSTQLLRPPKGSSEVSFNDTFSDFELCFIPLHTCFT